jgi:hypothetical protein
MIYFTLGSVIHVKSDSNKPSAQEGRFSINQEIMKNIKLSKERIKKGIIGTGIHG